MKVHIIKSNSVSVSENGYIDNIVNKSGTKGNLYIRFNDMWVWVKAECYTFEQLKNGIYKDRMRIY